MQRKDLALRVLSTAAIMSIVTSIAAPAFADIYYIGNGSIDVVTKEDANGKKYVEVKQGDKTYTDTSDEIVIKDGTDEDHTTLREDTRIKEKRAEVAIPDKERPATQELEAAGSADAAGESQPDPDAAFTLSEAEEDSAQTQEGKDTTEEKKEPAEDSPKEDVVYEYAPADPEPEQQATKPALSTPEEPEATAPEATQANAPAAAPTTPTAPAADPPAEGSADNPTTNVIKVVNNWVGEAAKELKIRLSNVNIKVEKKVNKAAMDVSGDGKTKVELDGQNVLDSSGTDYPASYQAGLRKQGEGTLIITDETDDRGNEITATKSGTSGSLTAKGAGGNGAAGIGGSAAEGTKNITIEGYATVHAAGGGSGAGIGGGDYSSGKVTISGGEINATGGYLGAGIGGGEKGRGDVTIEGNTEVNAAGGAGGAGIGGGYVAKNNSNQITIKSNENGSPTVNAVGGSRDKTTKFGGAGIGAGGDSTATTDITLEGKVTINATAGKDNAAIGANGIEQEFPGLAGGTSITRKDSDKNDISPLPGDNVPDTDTPSGGGSTGGDSTGGDSAGGDSAGGGSSGGGSADASVQESVFPGLVVTDKDGQRISYTSIRDNNVLSLRVGRFTASPRFAVHAAPAAG